ncbi:MAG: WhiB family transcriptional regulator [Actinomycetes bacterium]
MAWQDDSACMDADPELFFPIGSTGDAVPQISAAKAICRTCPVVGRCLEYALSSRQDFGVWGGMSEDERKSLRRSRQRAARRYSQSPVAA